MAVLEVQAEDLVDSVLQEHVTNGSIDDIVDVQGLYKYPGGQLCRRYNMDDTDLARDTRVLKREANVVTVIDKGRHGETRELRVMVNPCAAGLSAVETCMLLNLGCC